MVYQHPQNKFQYKIFLHFDFGLPYYNLICDCATSQCSPYNSFAELINSDHVMFSHLTFAGLLTQEISCKTPSLLHH